MDMALCSVIMPAYNAQKFINKAIESVLFQTYQNVELIIVDDASTDTTREIVLKYAEKDNRVAYYKLSKNQGCAYARNFGLEKAKGEYIAFLDSDDYWSKDKLQKQIIAIKTRRNTILITAYKMIDEKGKIIKRRNIKSTITYSDLLKENSIIFSTVLCRFTDIKDIKFKSDWYHEDYVFLLDCLNNGLKVCGVNKTLVYYRVHLKGRSFNKFKAAYNRWWIYREYLQMNFFESFRYFIFYTLHGVVKYI